MFIIIMILLDDHLSSLMAGTVLSCRSSNATLAPLLSIEHLLGCILSVGHDGCHVEVLLDDLGSLLNLVTVGREPLFQSTTVSVVLLHRVHTNLLQRWHKADRHCIHPCSRTWFARSRRNNERFFLNITITNRRSLFSIGNVCEISESKREALIWRMWQDTHRTRRGREGERD